MSIATPHHPATALSECFPLIVRPLVPFSDDQFYEFCRINGDLQIERTARGELSIVTTAGLQTSHLNLRIVIQLGQWAERDGTGIATESSGGFILPDSAVFGPDAAWVRNDRLATVPEDKRRRFLPLCPDFAIELLSPTSSLRQTQEKMREYIDNGLQLGWLIDPFERRVYVYRPGAAVQVLDSPDFVDGDPVLPRFRLDLRRVW